MCNNVDDFLNQCRILINSGNVDPFLNDIDNKRTLNMLGYNVQAMLQEIKELGVRDLFKGPVPDKSSKHPGDVWIFKKYIQGHLIYIKLKIRVIRGQRDLFIMSFHPDR